MKRTATLLASFLLATVTMTGTASAFPCDPTRCPVGPPTPRPRPTPVVTPLCVTTTWRAAHTHHRKTRPGEVCVLTPTMWLPHSWTVLADLGRDLLVQRPDVTR